MNAINSQAAVRREFWCRNYGRKPYRFYGKSQNDLPADVRCAFVDFVDSLARNGEITEELAQRVTL